MLRLHGRVLKLFIPFAMRESQSQWLKSIFPRPKSGQFHWTLSLPLQNYNHNLMSYKVPWITSDLLKGMRDHDVAKRKAIKSNNPQDWAMDKRLRNRINGEVKSTKASYYASAFVQSNGDSRKTWQLINELTSRQKNNASVKEIKLNENSVTNSHELSNAFNDHFSTIGTKLANEVLLVTDGCSQLCRLH